MTESSMDSRDWRQRPLPRLLVAVTCSALLFSSSAPLYAAPPVNALPVAAGNWLQAGSAASATVGNAMTVTQSSNRAILNWESFNIGRDASVRFDQPSASASALNRIGGNAPSEIFGQLSANGQIYLINNNGILFGEGAQVNVRGLVASTLNIDSDQFLNGTLGSAIASGDAIFAGGSAVDAAIIVDSGARLVAESGGQILMFAPTVENRGEIVTPDGQTLLAASSDRVYLVNSDRDSDLRGLLVEVGTGGDVRNVGRIIAERGNITLAGLAVNQGGTLRATTSVDVNGSIRLVARDGATAVNRSTSTDNRFIANQFLDGADELTGTSGDYLPQATRTGTVTLAQGSLTEVVADDSGKSATDAALQPQSRIQMLGATIALERDARVRAPAGRVDLVATTDPATVPRPGEARIGDGRIHLAEGSSIDVSGEHVLLPVERRTIEVELRGDELKDAPLQRDGVLRGKTVRVDIHQGSPLISDLSPWLATVRKGVRERMTDGGTVNLLSAGEVVVAGGVIDVSGGSISYEAGPVSTTKLLSLGGIVDIGVANPNQRYDGILGQGESIHPKWGKTIFGSNSLFERGTWHDGYTDGAGGGLLNIETPLLYGFDRLDLRAHTVQGQRQRIAAIEPSASRLNVNLAVGNSIVERILRLSQQASSQSLAVGDAIPGDAADTPMMISAEALNRSGIGSIALKTHGDAEVTADADLQLRPGAAIAIDAATITVDGRLRSAGGSIALTTGQQPVAVTDANAQFPLRLGAGALLDVSGNWSNDLFETARGAVPTGRVARDGGSIELFADGDLLIADGARLLADAGAQLTSGNQLIGGDGGRIALTTDATVNDDAGSRLQLPADALSAYGFGRGGTLSIEANAIAVGEASADPLTLLLDEAFFARGGFGSFELNANRHGIRIADGASIALRQRNYEINDIQAASRQRSGDSVSPLARIVTLRDELRGAVDLSLTAVRGAFGALGQGRIHIGSGSRIDGDAGARIAIAGDDSIYIDGALNAPGGSISIDLKLPPNADTKENYRADLAVWFGSGAALNVAATRELRQNSAGLLLADIFDAGTIAVNAQRGAIVAEPGSLFDVSGARFAIDRQRFSGTPLLGHYRDNVAAAAGSIEFSAAEALLIHGDLRGAGVTGGQSGSLAFRLDRNLRSIPIAGSSFPVGDLQIELQQALPAWAGLDFGAALPTALRGRGLVGADAVMAGGFGSLTLGAANTDNDLSPGAISGYGVVAFASDIDAGALSLVDTLWLDATQIDLRGHRVAIGAGQVRLGQDDNGITDTQNATAQYLRTATAGSGELQLDGRFIELLGNVGISGAERVTLNSSGDIRLRALTGIDPATGIAGRVLAPAQLQTPANLHLRAAQIYPSTLTDYTIRLTGADSLFSTSASGGARTPILAAGGSLKVDAPRIEHGGVLASPLGEILLGTAATREITLLAGSNLDVSASQPVPFGRLRADIDWIYPILASAPLVIAAPPEKRVELTADAIDMRDGARIDVSGGGDITAFEFIAGPGGSRDFLDAEHAGGGFAVVPWLGSEIAPHDTVEMAGSGIASGQVVWLEGGNGLPAGNYAVLPAHYALLPGAYLVTPVGGGWSPGQRVTTTAGTQIVAGRLGRAFGAGQASAWSGFSIETGEVVRARSQYIERSGNDYFADTGVDLARDAGRVVIDADSALQLNGVIGSQSQQGRGAQLDIVANAIEVVESTGSGGAAIQLAADALNGLGVDSLLLGGRRSREGGDTRIEVSADSVVIRGGAELSVPDLLLAARDEVTLESGASIRGSGASSVETERFLLDGDGAFLRASTASQADVVRGNVDGDRGMLTLAEGSSISGVRSVLLDATADMELQGALALEQGSLNLTANRISLGDAPAGGGVSFTPAQLAALNARELRLSSRSSIDFHGSIDFASDDVQFNAGALRSMVAGDVDVTAARSLQLSNTGDVVAPASNSGGGTLRLAAARVELGNERDDDTRMTLDGFDRVELGAAQLTQQIIGQGLFELAVGGDLAMTADRVTVAGGDDTRIEAGGAVTLARAGADPLGAATPMGGTLAVNAQRIVQGGVIDLIGGALALTANGAGADDGIVLLAGSETRVAGHSIAAPQGWVSGDAGAIRLHSTNGSIEAQAGAVVDLAGGEHGGDAGLLSIGAANGDVDWQATTHANAVAGASGGSLVVDKRTLADAGQWAALAGSAGFDRRVHLRARSGDVAIDSDIRAADIEIAADGGSLLLAATLDASGGKGGRVGLHAGADLTLTESARIDASASAADGRGGRVELGTQGALNSGGESGRLLLAAGSRIDVAGGGGDGRGGSVHLRAPRVAANSDVAVDIEAGAVIAGAETVVVEGVQRYDSDTLGSALLAMALGEADSFMAGEAAIAQRLAAVQGISVRPGIEVRSDADLTVSGGDIDLSGWRFGGDDRPGVLTLRARGDIVLRASLLDGLVDDVSELAFLTPLPNRVLLPGESWSYRLVAGADGDAAAPNAVNGGAGDLIIADGADIITGAGSIDLAAGGNIEAERVDSVIASLGLSAYSTYGADPFTGFDLPLPVPDTGTLHPALLFFTGAQYLMYPERGGDVSISAGGDIRFARAQGAEREHFFSDWLVRIAGDYGTLTGLTPPFTATTWGVWASYFSYGDQWGGGAANAQGVAVLGGGDLRLDAGRDIVNLNAALPVTGKQTGRLEGGLPVENRVQLLGGGDLFATAGRDIVSPRVLVDRGEAAFRAGGGIGAASGGGLDALFAIADTRLDVRAIGDIAIGAVTNSTLIPQSRFQALFTNPNVNLLPESYFFTYTDVARVNLASAGGDISLNHDSRALLETFQSRWQISRFLPGVGGVINLNAVGKDMFSLYPGSLDASALSGDIALHGETTLFPSSHGTLRLFSGNDIRVHESGTVRMTDVPLDQLAFAHNPTDTFFTAPNTLGGFDVGAAARLLGNRPAPLDYTPIHTGDTAPNWITALHGDIDGLNVVLPKQTRIRAGGDIGAASIVIQHADQHSISEILAGGDIRYGVEVLPSGQVSLGIGQIRISGPGRLDVIAGGDIDLGISGGIESLGNYNSSNRAIADNGADITVMAGINGATAVTDESLYAGLAQRYFAESDALTTSFIDWFAAGGFDGDAAQLVGVFTGRAYGSNAQAIAEFGTLPVLTRQVIALEAYQLHKAAVQSSASAADYAAAGGHRGAYSAELVDFVSSERFAGELASHVAAVTGESYASRRDAAAALALLSADRQHAVARAALDSAPLIARRELVLDTLVAEVRSGGIEDARGFLGNRGGLNGFERSDAAIGLLFPGDDWRGDFSLAFTALRTLDEGDINIFTPGGKIDVGLAGTVAGFNKSADQLGIVTSRYGAINAIARDDINVNASRIFSLDGAPITLWSSQGDIDAGKGAKTAVNVPPPQFVLQEDGTISTVFPPSVAGSGIQAANNLQKRATDLGALVDGAILVDRQRFHRSLAGGNAYLFAPRGTIDAGDAGIAVGGDLLLAAQQVVGADNISVGGISIGVPTTTAVSANTISLGDVASSATESATSSMNDAIRETAEALAEASVAFVTVDIIGVGE